MKLLLMMSTTRPAIVLAVGLTVALPTAARAQPSEPAAVTGTQVEDSGGSLLGDIGRDYRRFFTSRETAIILSIGIASSMGVRPFDGSIAGSRLNGELYQGTGIDAAFEGGELLGGALFQVGSAFATYGLGRAVGRPGVVSLGRDLVRAQLLTQGITQAMKYGRAADTPGRLEHRVVSVRPQLRHVRLGDRAPPPLRVEGGRTGLRRGNVGRRLAPEREQAFPE